MEGYTSTEDIYTHVQVCRDSLSNKTVFANFKRNPAYTRVLEHCSFKIACNAVVALNNICDIQTLPWESIRKNDSVGNPVKQDFKTYMSYYLLLEDYHFSPSTLQYVYQAVDLLKDFVEKDDKKDITVVEVGCGYGGLCKIINDIAPIFGLRISQYYLIDLPDVCAHQDKYLSELGVSNYRVVSYDSNEVQKIIGKHDIFISIYALGEFTKEICQFYLDNVIKYSNHVYLWWNLSFLNPYFEKDKGYKHLKTGILHDHPHGLDLKIVD